MESVTRRWFLGGVTAAASALPGSASSPNGRLAILGGEPVRKQRFPNWPRFGVLEENTLLEVLRSGKWFRGYGHRVERFEEDYAKLTGAAHCVATANGTSALFVSLNALGVGAGDEVIVPPYTFVATINVVLLQHALPVFVDSDLETFQIDAAKIERAITDRTKAMIPVHLGGSAADLDTILEIARRRNVPVIDDACQAHLAQWRGKHVGTLGATGCFSFQASKNLNSGEGGAILSNDAGLIERCYAFHNNGRGRKTDSYNFSYHLNGGNLRMTEFQGALLVAQMSRIEEQSKTREQNAAYLTSMLKEIPGIKPARMYEGCTRNAYHLYMFRYEKEQFAGAPRAAFLKALNAEGIPASGGYAPLNKEPFLKAALATRGYQRAFPAQALRQWEEKNRCPVNDRLCEEAIWLTQTMLLGNRTDMEQIAAAVRKIQAQADQLRPVA